MAALIYGGGLRVVGMLRASDQGSSTSTKGLVFVRSGKGDKDRSTLLAETGRRGVAGAPAASPEALHEPTAPTGSPACGCRTRWNRKYPNAGRELAWFWVFPSSTLSTDPRDRHRPSVPS